MNPPIEFRPPDTYSRIRSILTTLQLRIDLLVEAHGLNQSDATYLDAIHQDIYHLAEMVREKRSALREVRDRAS